MKFLINGWLIFIAVIQWCFNRTHRHPGHWHVIMKPSDKKKLICIQKQLELVSDECRPAITRLTPMLGYSYWIQTVVNGRKFSNIGDRCTQVSVASAMHPLLSVGFDWNDNISLLDAYHSRTCVCLQSSCVQILNPCIKYTVAIRRYEFFALVALCRATSSFRYRST